MKKFFIALVASVALASPALADQGRFEGRGGILWDGGSDEEVYGLAAGYDFDLGSKTFVGVEISGDQVDAPGTKVAFGFGARAGTRVGERGRLYVNGGYQTEPVTGFGGDPYAGAGFEQGIGPVAYLKVEYRHVFIDSTSDYDIVAVGVGVRM